MGEKMNGKNGKEIIQEKNEKKKMKGKKEKNVK